MKKEKGGERFENRVHVSNFKKINIQFTYCCFVVCVHQCCCTSTTHDIHNIYERLPTKYM